MHAYKQNSLKLSKERMDAGSIPASSTIKYITKSPGSERGIVYFIVGLFWIRQTVIVQWRIGDLSDLDREEKSKCSK